MSQDILRDDIEYLIHSDDNGNIIGPISKTHAHQEVIRAELTHYSTWSMIYYPKSGKYGIQLKNPKKHDKYSAGKWDMGVAGHNCYIKENGDFRPLDFDENLIKEAKEEIGIDIEMFGFKNEFLESINLTDESVGFIFDRFHYKTQTDNEWVGLGLVIVRDTDVKFEDDEVINFKWMAPNELKEFIEKNDNYCSPLPLVFDKVEKFRKENSI
jgi:isopentenyldiphosphate isomerase